MCEVCKFNLRPCHWGTLWDKHIFTTQFHLILSTLLSTLHACDIVPTHIKARQLGSIINNENQLTKYWYNYVSFKRSIYKIKQKKHIKKGSKKQFKPSARFPRRSHPGSFLCPSCSPRKPLDKCPARLSTCWRTLLPYRLWAWIPYRHPKYVESIYWCVHGCVRKRFWFWKLFYIFEK